MNDATHLTIEEHLHTCTHWSGPRQTQIAIAGNPYTGAHTRRAIRTAMTRAGVKTCTINGAEYNAAGLAYRHDLA